MKRNLPFVTSADAQHGGTIRDLHARGIIASVLVVRLDGVAVAECDSCLTAVSWMRSQGDTFYMSHEIRL